MKQKMKGKRVITCYLCGHEFSYASISIHQRECPKKMERELRIVPSPVQPKGLPSPPSVPIPGENDPSKSYEEYNSQATLIYRESLPQCPSCKRRFGHRSIESHLRGCCPTILPKEETKFVGSLSSLNSSFGPPSGGTPKRHIVCYMCGHEFSYASISIHQKKCPLKMKAICEIVPKRVRKPFPDPPSLKIPTANDLPEFYEQYNIAALSKYNASLPQCQCGRRFGHDRIITHLRSCAPQLLCEEDSPPQPSWELSLTEESRRPPRFVVCYLCGREFSYASISIHQRECPIKMEAVMLLVPKKVRGGLPDAPDLPLPTQTDPKDVFAAYNTVATQIFQESLPQCPCGRRFGHDRIASHLKSCAPQLLHEEQEVIQEGRGKPPRHVVCYLCGFEFSYASISIHQKECLAKTKKTHGVKKSQIYPKMPIAPELSLPTEGDPYDVYEQYNILARQSYKNSMPQCPCGRRFAPDRIFSHLRSCSPDLLKEEEEKLVSTNTSNSLPLRPPRHVDCYLCGQEFSYASIRIHQKDCATKEKTLRQIVPQGIPCDLASSPSLPLPEQNDDPSVYSAYNELATSSYRNSLPKCVCGRKFRSDRLLIHLRSCAPQLLLPKERKLKRTQSKPRNKTLTCHLCSAEFLCLALKHHTKSCFRIRSKERFIFPYHLRQNVSQWMKDKVPGIDDGIEAFDAYNKVAMSTYFGGLPSCPVCLKPFHAERLKKHMVQCCPEFLDTVIKDNAQRLQSQPPDESVILCHYCGIFISHSLASTHLSQCKKKSFRASQRLPQNFPQLPSPRPTPGGIPPLHAPPQRINDYNQKSMEKLVGFTASCPSRGCKFSGVPLVMLPHLSRCNPSLVKVEGELVRGGTRQRGKIFPVGKEREREKEAVVVELGEVEEEEGREGGDSWWSWWSSYLWVGFGYYGSYLSRSNSGDDLERGPEIEQEKEEGEKEEEEEEEKMEEDSAPSGLLRYLLCA